MKRGGVPIRNGMQILAAPRVSGEQILDHAIAGEVRAKDFAVVPRLANIRRAEQMYPFAGVLTQDLGNLEGLNLEFAADAVLAELARTQVDIKVAETDGPS